MRFTVCLQKGKCQQVRTLIQIFDFFFCLFVFLLVLFVFLLSFADMYVSMRTGGTSLITCYFSPDHASTKYCTTINLEGNTLLVKGRCWNRQLFVHAGTYTHSLSLSLSLACSRAFSFSCCILFCHFFLFACVHKY